MTSLKNIYTKSKVDNYTGAWSYQHPLLGDKSIRYPVRIIDFIA